MQDLDCNKQSLKIAATKIITSIDYFLKILIIDRGMNTNVIINIINGIVMNTIFIVNNISYKTGLSFLRSSLYDRKFNIFIIILSILKID